MMRTATLDPLWFPWDPLLLLLPLSDKKREKRERESVGREATLPRRDGDGASRRDLATRHNRGAHADLS